MPRIETQKANIKQWGNKLWPYALLTIFTLYILIEVVSHYLAHVATTVPSFKIPNKTPASYGLDYENITLVTNDNLHLKAWWLTKGTANLPTILIIHGLGARKESMLSYIRVAQKNGFPVLALDLRGHGESESSLTTIGYYEQQDIISALAYLGSHNITNTILWGTSMGAVIAIHVGAKQLDQTHAKISGIIADAPFDTLKATLAHHGKLLYGLPEFPFMTVTYSKIERKMKFDLDAVNSLLAVKKLECPILLLAAEHDVRMPVALVESIYQAAREPKYLWTIPKQNHEVRTFTCELEEQILLFLEKCQTEEVF
ncbi:MAG: alpha/beta fold hydrolase [Verrucomicrobiota bacterium]